MYTGFTQMLCTQPCTQTFLPQRLSLQATNAEVRRPGYKTMHNAVTLILCPSHPSPLHTPLRTVVLHDDGKQGPVQGQQGATVGWQLQSPSC